MDVCNGFFNTARGLSGKWPYYQSRARATLAFVVDADLFLGEAREVDDVIAISVDVKEIDAGAEMLHQ